MKIRTPEYVEKILTKPTNHKKNIFKIWQNNVEFNTNIVYNMLANVQF